MWIHCTYTPQLDLTWSRKISVKQMTLHGSLVNMFILGIPCFTSLVSFLTRPTKPQTSATFHFGVCHIIHFGSRHHPAVDSLWGWVRQLHGSPRLHVRRPSVIRLWDFDGFRLHVGQYRLVQSGLKLVEISWNPFKHWDVLGCARGTNHESLILATSLSGRFRR